jgi:hypothetical protein
MASRADANWLLWLCFDNHKHGSRMCTFVSIFLNSHIEKHGLFHHPWPIANPNIQISSTDIRQRSFQSLFYQYDRSFHNSHSNRKIFFLRTYCICTYFSFLLFLLFYQSRQRRQNFMFRSLHQENLQFSITLSRRLSSIFYFSIQISTTFTYNSHIWITLFNKAEN